MEYHATMNLCVYFVDYPERHLTTFVDLPTLRNMMREIGISEHNGTRERSILKSLNANQEAKVYE